MAPNLSAVRDRDGHVFVVCRKNKLRFRQYPIT
jgi:hypothetical protein